MKQIILVKLASFRLFQGGRRPPWNSRNEAKLTKMICFIRLIWLHTVNLASYGYLASYRMKVRVFANNGKKVRVFYKKVSPSIHQPVKSNRNAPRTLDSRESLAKRSAGLCFFTFFAEKKHGQKDRGKKGKKIKREREKKGTPKKFSPE